MGSRENSLTGVPQTQLVTLALYLLGGAATLIDTEDVAVKAQELAPGRFSWRKYPDQINLELVRVALNDARRKSDLVNGTGRGGWSLTVAGRRWVEENLEHLQGTDLSQPRQARTAGSIDEVRRQRERLRVMTSVAWIQWSDIQESGCITLDAAADLYRVDRYVIGRAREMKVNRLRQMFRDDTELAPLLDAAATVLLNQGDRHGDGTE